MTSLPLSHDYELLSSVAEPFVHIRFSGIFEHKTTMWDALIYTLDSYYNNNASPATSRDTARSFIDVGEMTPQGRRIVIGLDLDKIEQSTIIKTMIMIRQYKRLHTGRHEFGETNCTTDPT